MFLIINLKKIVAGHEQYNGKRENEGKKGGEEVEERERRQKYKADRVRKGRGEGMLLDF